MQQNGGEKMKWRNLNLKGRSGASLLLDMPYVFQNKKILDWKSIFAKLASIYDDIKVFCTTSLEMEINDLCAFKKSVFDCDGIIISRNNIYQLFNDEINLSISKRIKKLGIVSDNLRYYSAIHTAKKSGVFIEMIFHQDFGSSFLRSLADSVRYLDSYEEKKTETNNIDNNQFRLTEKQIPDLMTNFHINFSRDHYE